MIDKISALSFPIPNNLDHFMYEADNIKLGLGNGEYIMLLKEDIFTILISKEFVNKISPAVFITFMLSKQNYKTLTEYIDNSTMSFDLYKSFIGKIVDNTMIEERDTDSQKQLVSHFDMKCMNEANLNTAIPNLLSNLSSSEDSIATSGGDKVKVTLYLYDYNQLQKFKIKKSYILKGGINDCIYTAFKDRGLKNIIYESVNSNTSSTYSMIYGNLGENIKFLNDNYGIYRYPYILFMDTNRIYMHSRSNGLTGNALETGEYGNAVIYLKELNEGMNQKTGSFEISIGSGKNAGKMYGLLSNSFSIEDYDSSIDYAVGGVVKSVIRSTGKVITTVLPGATTKNEVTYTVNTENQHYQIVWNVLTGRRKFSIVFADADEFIFTPNKFFHIIPDDTFYSKDYKLEGMYVLDSAYFRYEKTNGDKLRLKVQCNLSMVQDFDY